VGWLVTDHFDVLLLVLSDVLNVEIICILARQLLVGRRHQRKEALQA
jgi:hypothetical protein